MKLRLALVFATIVTLSPALALAKTVAPSSHEHGSTMHDRSPRIHSHESQLHH